MTISFSGGPILAPASVQFGWLECDIDCIFQPITTFPVVDGALQSHTLDFEEPPGIYGQVSVVQFPGFRAYGDPFPGPGIPLTLDLDRFTATLGSIAGNHWQPTTLELVSFTHSLSETTFRMSATVRALEGDQVIVPYEVLLDGSPVDLGQFLGGMEGDIFRAEYSRIIYPEVHGDYQFQFTSYTGSVLTTPPVTVVPEPSVGLLFVLGTVLLLRRIRP